MKCTINKKICIVKNEYMPIFKLIYKTAPIYYYFLLLSAIMNFVQIRINVWVIEKIVDFAAQKELNTSFLYILLIFAVTELGLVFLKLVMEYLQNMIIPKVREKMKLEMSIKMMSIPYDMLEDKKFLDLKDKAVFAITNKSAIYNFVFYFSDLINNIAIVISVAIVMIQLSIFYMVLIGFSVFLISISYSRYMKFQKKFYDSFVINSRREELYNEMSFDKSYALDFRINSIKKLLNKNYNEFIQSNEDAMKEFYNTKGKYLGLISILEKIVYAFSYIYIVISYFTASGRIVSPGTFAKYVSAMTSYFSKIENICLDIIQLRQMKNYLEPFMYFVNTTNFTQTGNKIVVDEKINEIRFENVSYKYPNVNKWAIKNVNFIIKSGSSVAFIGSNGSGKSTLIKLICGLIEPTEGRVLINGRDLKKYDFTKSISTVFQDYNLFNYSIKKNIVFNDDSKSINFNEFADNWGLFEILNKFSKGYNTIIGKEFDRNGIELSGGESQKIAIARAGYKKASLYILDEPTSALDVHAETFFVEKTAGFTESNIVIIVSHNLLTTKNCDKIFVIDDGEVIEEGTHKNLLEKNKVYADMYKSNIQKWR